jgi:uncharacterized protein (TIGR00725 family)
MQHLSNVFIQVTVIGSSGSSKYKEEAYFIGSYIAEKKCTLISGGRDGIMEGASKGASESNGIVVAILPGEDFSQVNKYSNIVIPTGIGYARNSMNVLAADIVVSMEGKTGTLSEIAYAMQYNKPIICCSYTDGWSNNITLTLKN